MLGGSLSHMRRLLIDTSVSKPNLWVSVVQAPEWNHSGILCANPLASWTPEWPQSLLQGSKEFSSWALLEFLTHRIWGIIKQLFPATKFSVIYYKEISTSILCQNQNSLCPWRLLNIFLFLRSWFCSFFQFLRGWSWGKEPAARTSSSLCHQLRLACFSCELAWSAFICCNSARGQLRVSPLAAAYLQFISGFLDCSTRVNPNPNRAWRKACSYEFPEETVPLHIAQAKMDKLPKCASMVSLRVFFFSSTFFHWRRSSSRD